MRLENKINLNKTKGKYKCSRCRFSVYDLEYGARLQCLVRDL